MKNKFLLVSAVALLALLVSACGPTTINQAAQPPQRTINVSGSGQAYLVPDIAYIYLGVHTELPSASEAVTGNNAQTEKMIKAHPERVIEWAVEGMLPKGRLGRAMAKKLKVYRGSEHPHSAQKPEPLLTGGRTSS